MRKTLTIALVLVFAAVLLVGCGAKSYKDGTYDHTIAADTQGYTKTIKVTVAGGKITSAVYDEISKDNKKKSEDADYKAIWQKKLATADPKAFYTKLSESLVKSQDPTKVDAVAGATESTKTFKEAATKALEKAK